MTLGFGELKGPIATQAFPDMLANGLPMPRWSGGLLISWRQDTPASDPNPNLHIVDRQGKTVSRRRFWIPDSSAVKIFAAAASDAKQLAVVGHSTGPTGPYTGYLTIIDLQTNATKIIQTGPFEGQSVTWGPHDSLWVLGYQLTAARKLLAAPPHAILRQFDRRGKQIAEHLPWPAINCGRHPLLEGAELTASPTRISILLTGCQSWIELSPAGQLLGRWPLTLPTGFTPSECIWKSR